jgi:hypothetical protein
MVILPPKSTRWRTDVDPFWETIKEQIAELRTAEGAADVVRILSPERCPHMGRYGSRAGFMDARASGFFAGSGGDSTVWDALDDAGWTTVWSESSMYYALRAPDGSVITYCEGDIYDHDVKGRLSR